MSGNFRVRDIDSTSAGEIEQVALNMRQTLVDVMGEEHGATYYTLEWLRDRVRWHLDPVKTQARILLLERDDGKILGQAIARVERDEQGAIYGYFSTLFVDQSARRQGLGARLMGYVEQWFRKLGLPRMVYNTAANNGRLIPLFERNGYRIVRTEGEMVQLEKILV